VKSAVSVATRDFKGLRHLKDTEPNRFKRGVILYCGREVVPFSRDLLVAIPI
jgi:hypothetical protein